MTEKFTNLFFWIGIVLAIAGYGHQLNTILGADSNGPESNVIISQLCYLGSWICFLTDYFKLKTNGLRYPHWAWIVIYGLFPIYIWKRASLLDGDRKPFWVCMGGIVLLIGLLAVNFMILDTQERYKAEVTPNAAGNSQHKGLSGDEREKIADWLQSMSYEFQTIKLASASIPIYYNQLNGGLLGFISFANQEYIFASSVSESSMTTCALFSEFSYVDGEIVLAECPDASGGYSKERDCFVFKQDINGCGLCGMGATLQGKYERIASCFCEMQSDGELIVKQVLAE